MAFSTKKLGADDINGGNEFTNGQGLQPNDINSIVKGVLWLNEKGGSGGTNGNAKIYLHKISIEPSNNEYYFCSTKEEVFCTVDDENIIIPTNYVTTILGCAYFEYNFNNSVYIANLFSHNPSSSQTIIEVGGIYSFSETSQAIIL